VTSHITNLEGLGNECPKNCLELSYLGCVKCTSLGLLLELATNKVWGGSTRELGDKKILSLGKSILEKALENVQEKKLCLQDQHLCLERKEKAI